MLRLQKGQRQGSLPRTASAVKRNSTIAFFLIALACAFLGCKNPMKVAMNGNITGDVITRMPPDNTAKPVTERTIAGDSRHCAKIAIIDVDGMLLNQNFKGMESLGENPVALFHEKLNAAARDPQIRGVLIRLNSPGGSVTACDLMRRDLVKFKESTGKPVVTSILDIGAGGAYYLATASDTIFAHPTSIVGGVGVIINIFNLSDALEQQNIQPTPIRAGEHIDLGSPSAPLTKDGKLMLSEMANEFHERFKAAVIETRPHASAEDLDGRVFTASHAKANAFIDDVLYFDEAIKYTQNLSGAGEASRVVLFRRANDRALTEFDITPNTPVSLASIPLSIPGYDRAKLPHFLYLWQPEPGLEANGY